MTNIRLTDFTITIPRMTPKLSNSISYLRVFQFLQLFLTYRSNKKQQKAQKFKTITDRWSYAYISVPIFMSACKI